MTTSPNPSTSTSSSRVYAPIYGASFHPKPESKKSWLAISKSISMDIGSLYAERRSGSLPKSSICLPTSQNPQIKLSPIPYYFGRYGDRKVQIRTSISASSSANSGKNWRPAEKNTTSRQSLGWDIASPRGSDSTGRLSGKTTLFGSPP